MYNVSNAYKIATTEPAQTHRLTGTIGSVSFDESNIVAGSFNIQKQSTDTSDVVLGSAYIGQLTATFTGINISRQAWIGAVISPVFGLYVNNAWETVPLGLYIVKKATHTAEGVEVTAYDYMCKFDKIIKNKKNNLGFVTDSMYDFISLACTKCDVTLGMTKAQIDALPNGYRSQGDIEIYGDAKATDFANDIETYRDLLFWCAQTMGCFCTVDRTGQLIFKQYNQNIVETISDNNRLSGASFEDYTTHYTGVYFTDMDTNEEVYYGYNVAELEAQIAETLSDLEETEDAIQENVAALVTLEEQYAQGQITEEEYLAQKATLQAERKALDKTLSKLEKRLKWLQDALAKAQAEDDGATMDCGANPFLQYENLTKRDNTRKRVLAALDNISYTPFQCSLLCGAHYDLGDVIYFTGGHAEDDICCVMAWSYTHNQGTEIQGFGVDPSQYMIKSKARKEAKKATSTAINTGHTYVAENDSSTSTGAPQGSKNGDIWVTPYRETQVEDFNRAYTYGMWGNSSFYEGDSWVLYSLAVSITNGDFIAIANGFGDTRTFNGDEHVIVSPLYVFRVKKGQSANPSFFINIASQGDKAEQTGVVERVQLNPTNDMSTHTPYIVPHNDDPSYEWYDPNFDYYYIRFAAGTIAFGYQNVGQCDYVYDTGISLDTVLQYIKNGTIVFPPIRYITEITEDKLKYNDNGTWRDLAYVRKTEVDESAEAGGTDWNGINLVNDDSDITLSLKKNVMRAWYKADPPQTERNFSQFCVRYTGKPDTGITIESYDHTTWENISIKADDENAYKIQCGGIGGSMKYCVYQITGLTQAKEYYFNFAVNWSDNATFGKDTDKGLGLVFSKYGTIASDTYSGDEDTFNDTTKYYSMRRTRTKNYADFHFTANAATMYMFVITEDLTNVDDASVTLSEFVISDTERKLIRDIYLYDYTENAWLKYRPFGSITSGGDESGGSVVTITPTLQSGQKIADFSIDGNNGILYAPDNSYTLPVASANTLGGIKVGQNLSIDQNGVLSATGGGGGTTVIANPSGTPTETLNTIQIGNTIYSLPSGGNGGLLSENNYDVLGQYDNNFIENISVEVV